MIGIERAQSFGHLMAAGVLVAGSVGLFAGGLAAVIGTIAAAACLGGVCLAHVAERREFLREEAIRDRLPPFEPAPPVISEEADIALPEKSWVASLDTPRSGRSR